jgi:hypothetical protein
MASLWDTLADVGEAIYDWGADAADDVVGFFGGSSTEFDVSDWMDDPEAMSWLAETGTEPSFLDYAGDFASGAWDYVSNTATEAYDWATNSKLAKAGAAAAVSLYGKDGRPEFGTPTAKRLSGASRTSGTASSGGYKASAADFGFTPQVQRAMQSAINSNMGYGSLEQAIAMLKGRRSQGPFLQLESPQINVKSRSRQV